MKVGENDYYYVHDHLYSSAALLNSSGTVLERYEYDAYGNPTIWNADFTTERDNSNYGNPYLFTGRRVDILDSGSLKIQYNRNRYYDYYSGRWLTHDPLGITPNAQKLNDFGIIHQYTDGLNLYQYVTGNPVVNVDPNGLFLAFDLTSVCDNYSCKQCCDVGVIYDDDARNWCYVEALTLTYRYNWGLINYWATAPWYTECHEYAAYITRTMKPAAGLKFFSLAEGGYRTWIGGEHHYVGVFHACNREEFYGALLLGDTSDATLDPWSRGFPPYIFNIGYGNPHAQAGRTSEFAWIRSR